MRPGSKTAGRSWHHVVVAQFLGKAKARRTALFLGTVVLQGLKDRHDHNDDWSSSWDDKTERRSTRPRLTPKEPSFPPPPHVLHGRVPGSSRPAEPSEGPCHGVRQGTCRSVRAREGDETAVKGSCTYGQLF